MMLLSQKERKRIYYQLLILPVLVKSRTSLIVLFKVLPCVENHKISNQEVVNSTPLQSGINRNLFSIEAHFSKFESLVELEMEKLSA